MIRMSASLYRPASRRQLSNGTVAPAAALFVLSVLAKRGSLGTIGSGSQMQLRVGPPPNLPEFVPSSPWIALREPTPWVFQLCALPLGVAASLALGVLWFLLTPLSGPAFVSMFDSILPFLSFGPLIVVHELIHAVVHPQYGKSDLTILGFWPTRVLFYAHYTGELTRNRFIAISVMPTLVISLAPLAVSAVAGFARSLVAWISIWNVFFACGDLFGVALLLFQVPSRASVRNQGWKTYWRTNESGVA